MTAKTVAQKARVKPGTTIAVLNPVPDVVRRGRCPLPIPSLPPFRGLVTLTTNSILANLL